MMFTQGRYLLLALTAAVMLAGTGPVSGQSYPTRPVRIVTAGVGGGNDFVSRLTPHVQSGRLRALAHTSDQPSTLYPGVPTVAATVPGFRAVSFTGMFVPAKTPEAIVKRLNQEVVRFLRTAEARERLAHEGAEPVARPRN